jgi:copper chaperone
MEKLTLKVGGMSCEHCAKAVTKAVTGVSGMANVSVDLHGGTVSFDYDPNKKPLDDIKAAIIEEGYTVTD